MTRSYNKVILAVLGLILACLTNCHEGHSFSSDPSHRLTFSTDTVTFDTLFTRVSSSTYSFLIFNNNDTDLHIVTAYLSDSDNSPFRVNIDGLSGSTFSDLTIRSSDSLFVFVEVTIDPRGQDAPFEVCDSLLFVLESGITQQVQLRAYGQDATVLRGLVVDSDIHLTSRRPYLIYDSLRIDEGATLYLDAGTRLYFRDKVEMQVYGRIEAVGTKENPIIFRGARTDHMFSYLPYDRLSAQRYGTHLSLPHRF